MGKDQKKLFEETVLENTKSDNIDDFTENFINRIDFNNQGIAVKKLCWLGIFIANQFSFCNAAESRKRLHEMKPHLYREAIEDDRIKGIEIAAKIFNNTVKNFSSNFSPQNAFSGLLDIGIMRESAIKALSEGVKLANRKDDEEKIEVFSLVDSLMNSINVNIGLYNEALTWGEDNRRLNIHANDPERTQKARVLRLVSPITESEVGL